MASKIELMAKNRPTTLNRFTFQLSHSVIGTITLQDDDGPDGWDPEEYVMDRNMDVFGVFYKGTSNVLLFAKAGRDFLQACYELDFVNGKVDFIVTENTPSGLALNRFTGKIGLDTYTISEIGVEVQVASGQFEDLVISRGDTEVNLMGRVSIDNVALSAPDTRDITVPEINILESSSWGPRDGIGVLDENHSVQVTIIESEFEEAKSLTTLFGYLFENALQAYSGAVLEILIKAVSNGSSGSAQYTWFFYLERWVGGVSTEVIWSDSYASTGHFPMAINIDENVTFTINEGDSIKLRAEIVNDVGTGDIEYTDIFLKLSCQIETIPSFLFKGFLFHEAFERIISHLTGETGKFYSQALGRTDIGYAADGIIGAFTSGRYIRHSWGVNNSIPMSLNGAFESLSAIHNLGMGFETINGVKMFVIEHMSHFFQSTVILDLSDRIAEETIGKSVYPALIFNRIKAGFNSYSYDRLGGIYEYNTANQYTTPIIPIDKQLSLISPYRADSTGIITLRKEPVANRDVSGENDIFIIDSIRDGLNYIARTWEGFDTGSIIGQTDVLLNLFITPARNLIRWGSYIRGFADKFLSMLLVWQTSDKNTTLRTTSTGESEIKENANIIISSLEEPLWHSEIYEVEVKGLEADIEAIKAQPYGLFKLSDTKYGWLLHLGINNEDNLIKLKLLRANLTYVTPMLPETVTGFGRLYNFYALEDIRGMVPAGWHVATSADWLALDTQLGGFPLSGAGLKEVGTDHWEAPNTGATNAEGFYAFGAGTRDELGAWSNYLEYGIFWAATEWNEIWGFSASLYFLNEVLGLGNLYSKNYGLPIRLVKDDDINPGYVVDYDGNVYGTTKIGSQVWTRRNWKVTHYNNGDVIPVITSNSAWEALSTGATCSPNNNDNLI